MYYTYILQSLRNGSYYIGSCKNIKNRVKMRNTALVKSTKRYIPWKIVYSEDFENLSAARSRESQIKSWKKRIYIKNLIKSRIHDNSGGPVV